MMTKTVPSSLHGAELERRLGELAGDEREVQADFLLHLDEFDRRLAFRGAGYPSLWEYCLRVLHLREGAAGRRIGAMRVLRRFPSLEAPLRDGRLCLSTVILLGPVVADDNVEDLVARAAFRTKAEVEHLVVSLKPRVAPKEGIRKLPTPSPASAGCESLPDRASRPEQERDVATPTSSTAPVVPVPTLVPAADASPAEPVPPPTVRRAAEMTPVSAGRYSLRVTIDATLKEELETLAALLSHKISDGDLAAVLREAIHCATEKHGKRRGAVALARVRSKTTAAAPVAPQPDDTPAPGGVADAVAATAERGGCRPDGRAISSATRRAVWARDGGRCTFVAEDGHRCESRWQLEIDHVRSPHHGGTADASNLRLRCRVHNLFHAERVFGRQHMARFRRAAERPR